MKLINDECERIEIENTRETERQKKQRGYLDQYSCLPCLTSVKPFLKWAGGKTWLLPTLQQLRPKEFRNYHEPFLGGGSHFFDLRSQGYKGTSYLYDLNKELLRTYHAIKLIPCSVLNELDVHIACHSEPYFLELREQNLRELGNAEIAARMIYLNKAGSNGLYKVNKQGKCNIPWGKKDAITIDEFNIHKARTALENTVITLGDFANVLENAQDGDFALLDPPYPDGFTQYTSVGFDETDQKRLHEVCLELNNRNVSFIQTNADCDFIRYLYRDFEIIPVEARRNINCKGNGRGKVGEVLIMNY